LTLTDLIFRLQDIHSYLGTGDIPVFIRNLAEVGDEDLAITDFEIRIESKQVVIL